VASGRRIWRRLRHWRSLEGGCPFLSMSCCPSPRNPASSPHIASLPWFLCGRGVIHADALALLSLSHRTHSS
jgi:hypothetical protein